jgi:MoxR-like ATPase
MTASPSSPFSRTLAAPLSEDVLQEVASLVSRLRTSLRSTVVGQEMAIDDLITGLLAGGHVLLEGVPGVAKTLLARAVAAATGLRFARVQFTPDLMPADLVGTRVYSAETRTWEVHKGPVFCEVLLADEINRTPPKTQAALLEAMEERQVTLDGTRHELGATFFVVATQNPLEFEGTYPLPEAQTDRFLLKVVVDYPPPDAELSLLRGGGRHHRVSLEPVTSQQDLVFVQRAVGMVHVEESVLRYVLALVHNTRTSTALRLGASPRAGLMLVRAAQARALMTGRGFVLPDDVKTVAIAVLRHRLSLSTEAELDGLTLARVLEGLLDKTAVLPAEASSTPAPPLSSR